MSVIYDVIRCGHDPHCQEMTGPRQTRSKRMFSETHRTSNANTYAPSSNVTKSGSGSPGQNCDTCDSNSLLAPRWGILSLSVMYRSSPGEVTACEHETKITHGQHQWQDRPTFSNAFLSSNDNRS